ncbi:relaxase/mobilization nuclease-like protein [Flavobacterium sp. 90]|uniref:relaxase/mobilization nuclease domain-containing protein n=1 Tax=unclassified Flavobacterium TaxID=196869 RepID=UPI000EB08D7E|nr:MULTISPECIES: relaxase/mobilization nuclease domain-containing protein [unclassified Flavobacterium]RKR05143.1 relaxase/mobilization nuclease-like protein [Flavobacterium sp. 81]TCK56458.1 relaxase/mobilization nuclease-like protein [Flavobacterium sp. 90]
MVAIINTGHSLRSIFHYNENKVSIGAAQCIGEGNYPMDVDQMSLDFKLKLLLKQLELNENVTRNSVHISLNFDPSETGLSKEKLIEIASIYMAKIGFGLQPYLVYQHHDAGHPHIHIVSIKVQSNGKRIDMQNIGKNQSETARKEIEKQFNLVQASTRNKKQQTDLKAINIQKVQYGRSETKKAISGILNAVVPHYKFTTIGELNAVLNLYNVSAERGREDSKMFLYRGLVYRIIDNEKKAVGVPIKASSLYTKPTLEYLEKKFTSNKTARLSDLKRIKNEIDLAFLNSRKTTFEQLETTLQKKGIAIAGRRNDQGFLFGITYIDHTTKCVCNGSVLGKSYAAKAIQYRCENTSIDKDLTAFQKVGKFKNKAEVIQNTSCDTLQDQDKILSSDSELKELIDSILQYEYVGNYVPNQLKGRRKKRKRKGQSDNQ